MKPLISRIYFAFAILFVVIVQSCNTVEIKSEKKPNVILILTDDQGYGDLSCHGNPYINTPNIDKLYKESVRFTNFHVDPTCAPTRAALMTGKYAHNVGVWHTISGGNHLQSAEITMANVFKNSGYKTALFGKWHLGSNYPYRPMDRGFDEWLGQGDGGTGTTYDYFYNDRVNDYYWHNGERTQIKGFAPDVFYNSAIDFINKNKEEDKPFFIYLPTYLPHDPHTLPDPAWAETDNPDVSKYVSYFFKGIERIDWNINKLRNTLEQLNLAENTIIIFMSDNGGTAGVKLFNAGMRGRKGQVYEGGHRVPFFMHWSKGNLKHGADVNDLTSHIDLLPTLMDLCNIKPENSIDFDGRSFKTQLFNSEEKLPERTLFVETQRTQKAIPWKNTVGMTNRWRLIDDIELYDIKNDPAQTNNVFEKHPEIVKNIRDSHKKYWAKVTPNDREKPKFIIGNKNDKETFLTPSDWYLANAPWNHAQVAAGSKQVGEWYITVEKEGLYRFEVCRWPKEANATIQGVPNFHQKKDAWNSNGPVEKLIYGNKITSLPIQSIELNVGQFSETILVNPNDKKVIFDIDLKVGDTKVKGIMYDNKNQILAGAYYTYITRLK